MINISATTITPTTPTTNIIFECKNLYEDMGLLLLKNNKDEFELHLYNSYTSDSMMMTLDIKDLAKLCSALSGYFEKIIEI